MKNFASQFRLAATDLITSIHRSKLWLYLGWIDIQQRYKGSILGPAWITLSMVVFVGVLSVVYAQIFHQEIATFLPFLTAGMVTWTFISTVLIESANIFVQSNALIENVKLPYLIYVFRLIWCNQIIFFHNAIVLIFIVLFFKGGISKNILYFFPGFILVTFLMAWLGLMIALLGARFRDVSPVISNLITLVFFISPITWRPEAIGTQCWILAFNPMYYLLDLLRSPLLGQVPLQESWLVCFGLLCIAFIVSFFLFCRYRSRIAFWI